MATEVVNTSEKGGSNQPQDTSGVTNEITNKLLEQNGIISSQSSNIEESIGRAKEGIRQSADFSSQRIESQFDREISDAERVSGLRIAGAREGQSGGTNMVALRNMVQTTDKHLNDLAQRKEELILQNDSNAAAQISRLELQSLEFRQKAQQQTFTNLLGIAGVQQASNQFRLQERAQGFQENQAKGNIALQFGLTAQPGESIESLITRAAPLATEDRRLQLEQMRSSIAQSKASASRINAAIRKEQSLANQSPEEIANAIKSGLVDATEAYSAADTSDKRKAIINAHEDVQLTAIVPDLADMRSGGTSKQDAIDTLLAANPGVSDIKIQELVDEYYDFNPSKKGVSAQDAIGEFMVGFGIASTEILSLGTFDTSASKAQLKKIKEFNRNK